LDAENKSPETLNTPAPSRSKEFGKFPCNRLGLPSTFTSIMKLKIAIPSLAAALLAALPTANAQNATTDPVGFVTVNITAGTGTAKRSTLVSVPLLDTASINGQAVGTITSFTSNSISNSAAGWTPGQLSVAATPYLIQMTSGVADGAMFLISTTVNNTATTVTINSEDLANSNLSQLGIAPGDGYKIIPCDTLSTLFGTPASTGILGGANSTVADDIQITINGQVRTYFFSSSSNRWTQVAFQSPNASNVPLRPYLGIRYNRRASTPLKLTATGNVPVDQRKVSVKNSGQTLLSQYFPVDSTLLSLGIQNIPNWTAGANANAADTVQINTNGTTRTFFWNGTNWKEPVFGNPTRDTLVIPAGSSILLMQRGNLAGYSTYSQNLPYNL